ncbi:hypothetical protein AOQ84DRAFT_379327 [Glonium stellatum]|uniref:PNPLA domain-containing protein n=1 Tax=Glonium stellatum TaxID=574774 RepID=A0A8E2EVL6_9PEZI|nr:hypothetical protein AOQ84DRAFT_379327 [Glonium stellatum]
MNSRAFTRYKTLPLKEAVQCIVKQHCKRHGNNCDGNDLYAWTADELQGQKMCQSICLSAVNNSRISDPYLLRTYNHRYNVAPEWVHRHNEGPCYLSIPMTMLATSAAPFYFKPLKVSISGKTLLFKDGGIRKNKPSTTAYNEFSSLPGRASEPGVLLSIGTGLRDESHDGFAKNRGFFPRTAEKTAIVKNMVAKYTDSESEHEAMLKVARGNTGWYRRVNVPGLENMELDDWKSGYQKNTGKRVPGLRTIATMEECVTKYFSREFNPSLDNSASPKEVIEQVAEKLVRTRRYWMERGRHVSGGF